MKGKTPYTVFVKGLPKEKKRCKTQGSNCITETARQDGTVRRQPSLYIFYNNDTLELSAQYSQMATHCSSITFTNKNLLYAFSSPSIP